MTTKLKKVTLPIFTGFVSLQISTLFLFGMVIGYLVTDFFAERADSIKIRVGKYRIHLHHWMFALSGLAVVFLANIQHLFPPFILGLGGGCLFHGIYCYNDWHRILKKV